MNQEDYERKTFEIEKALDNLRVIGKEFPLLKALIKRKDDSKKEYFGRINYNLMVHGSSPMYFDDIEYCLTLKKP